MAFHYLTNIPLDKARQDYIDILEQNGMAPKREKVPVTESAGRVASAPVYARICSPHYNACAMDGIALAAKLTFGATETTPAILAAAQYERVDTGDPLPDGCDAVVMIEDVIEDGGVVKLYAAAVPWQHIRQIGEDICAGEMLLTTFSHITPAATGAMIAGGVTEIEVFRRPAVGIIPTGDELVPPSTEPKSGDIPEFNSAIFSAMLREWGAETVTYPIVKDEIVLIREAIKTALAECDIVILNAGSSAGSEDYAAEAIASTGAVLYHGIAIKPGKPAVLGYSGAKPVLGVPGYPVSGIIVIEELLRPIVQRLCGKPPARYEHARAILSKPLVSTLKYREFVRVRLGYVEGRMIASPLGRGSGIVTSFMKADGIIEVSQDSEGYGNGAEVEVRLLRPISEIERSVVVSGSHDPLLDELSELMRVKYGDISMGSSHVGSMGGMMALRRGEAHAAGTHLLDEATGGYNASFVKRYFPKGGVRLVECVMRSQGIMLRPGNPMGVAGVADLARGGLRYVNRQKGSGTRVLIDYLCRKDGVDTSKIYGYNREEFTHTSVAALIAADSADAGLGVYSSAKLYGLDFLPVCDEQYDLLIPDYAWDTHMVQKLLETLRSDEFRERLDSLGGYKTVHPGTVREI